MLVFYLFGIKEREESTVLLENDFQHLIPSMRKHLHPKDGLNFLSYIMNVIQMVEFVVSSQKIINRKED